MSSKRRLQETRAGRRGLPILAAALGALCLAALPASAGAAGGPVILGGDDLTDHGSVDAGLLSQAGWLYIERAIGNVRSNVTRPGDNTIAAFGSADSPVNPGDSSDAGKAIRNAATKNGMGVVFFDGAASIDAGFASIADGSYRPSIIWIAGDDALNDIDSCTGAGSEGEAITANAGVINNFVNLGGGLMSHGTCYTWLTALIPGLSTPPELAAPTADLYLTPEGLAAFPGLTNADVGAGPWHSLFEGDLGGMSALARSSTIDDSFGADAAVIIGGVQVSLTFGPADLSITKTAAPTGSMPAGSNLTYTLTVTNHGPNPAFGARVTDTLPAGVTFVSATASQGSCSGPNCSLGDMSSGASATVRIVVRPTAAGVITNRANVAGDQPDLNPTNDQATYSTNVLAVTDRAKPRVALAGVRAKGCRRVSFQARIRVREAHLRSVDVYLGARRIRRSARDSFTVRIAANRLKGGKHTVRVVATDRSGNRTVRRASFRRCTRPAQARFTG